VARVGGAIGGFGGSLARASALCLALLAPLGACFALLAAPRGPLLRGLVNARLLAPWLQ
jgi:hypothetical protein